MSHAAMPTECNSARERALKHTVKLTMRQAVACLFPEGALHKYLSGWFPILLVVYTSATIAGWDPDETAEAK